MPTAIIVGLPLVVDQRVQAALKNRSPFPEEWTVIWIRSVARIPGIAPSQIDDVRTTAEAVEDPHILIFRGHEKQLKNSILDQLVPHFRMRWLDPQLVKLVPHQTDEFFSNILAVLSEETEWNETVKPVEASCCLLLPECAFSAEREVRHLWAAATQAPLERIRLAARAKVQFKKIHWQRSLKTVGHAPSAFAWTDTENRVFDHRGVRHGVSPFTRAWKYSFKIPDGFHYDIKSADCRPFHVVAVNGKRHTSHGTGHINLDTHGYAI